MASLHRLTALKWSGATARSTEPSEWRGFQPVNSLDASLLEQDKHESEGDRERGKPEDAQQEATKRDKRSEARPRDDANKGVRRRGSRHVNHRGSG